MTESLSPKAMFEAGKLTGGKERTRTYSLGAAPSPKQCRWCWGEITEKRRSTWCSTACVNQYNDLRTAFDPTQQRHLVSERDQGVCAICGLDTVALKKRLFPRVPQFDNLYSWSNQSELLVGIGIRLRENVLKFCEQIEAFDKAVIESARAIAEHPWCAKRQESQHFWEMDHILPVSEGGGCTTLENLRSLCLRCHWTLSGELRKRLNRKTKKTYNVLEK